MADRETSLRSQGYRPEENVAVANWRESIAGSQLAGDCLVADAIDHIEEIRRLQRRIRSIIRKSSIGGAWKTSKRF